MSREPDWVEHAICWQVYPLGFLGADTTTNTAPAGRTLAELEPWLDYAIRLGASVLALGPVFAAESHGYDTLDHHAIDPRLGGRAEFDRLLTQAHERGLKVLLDGVFGHVGRGHPRFRQALADGPNSDAGRWFRRDPGAADGWGTFEGHHRLVAFDHTHPPVAEHVAAVMNHWLDAGADGWRLDAAYAVPAEFWARTLPAVRAKNPQAYLFGEVIHGDYGAFVAEAGLDAVTQYELWKAIWSSLNDGNLFELAWALRRHDEWTRSFAPVTFLGNHDVTRIASILTDRRHLPHAVALLFCLPGTPSVYAGDEQAFQGVKEDRIGGDDAVRPAFPATPAELAPWGADTFGLHQDLAGLRRRHPWLHRARVETTHLANTAAVLAFTPAEGHAPELALALNLADEPTTVPVGVAGSVLAGAAESRPGAVLLAPHGWAVLGATP
jgi:cyclomaltodextrinase